MLLGWMRTKEKDLVISSYCNPLLSSGRTLRYVAYI